MKILELFCGTKSVGKVCSENGWEVVSVDINSKFKPDICCNIQDFDFRQYEPGHFDVIWASPPCCYFSKLRKSYIGRYVKKHGAILTMEMVKNDIINHGLPLLNRTLEIIDYLKPTHYFIENPQSGCMKSFITDRNYIDVDYCRFGFDYRKRTRIWTNKTLENRLCLGKGRCDKMSGTKHQMMIGREKSIIQKTKYRVPPDLVRYLIIS